MKRRGHDNFIVGIVMAAVFIPIMVTSPGASSTLGSQHPNGGCPPPDSEYVAKVVSCETALGANKSDEDRLEALNYWLLSLANVSFDASVLQRDGGAKACAEEALTLAKRLRESHRFNTSLETHHAHLLLGHLALARKDVRVATQELLAAGDVTGSPYLNSFGPNMALAAQLISSGQSDAPIEYLERVHLFWAMDYGDIARWRATIESGRVPDFETNCFY